MQSANDPNGKRPVQDSWKDLTMWDAIDEFEISETEEGTQAMSVRGQLHEGVQDFNYEDLDERDVMSMKFNTENEAEAFYVMLGRATGFSVRKSYKLKDPETGRVRYRQWVCSRHGLRDEKHIQREDRQREPKAVTRVDCKACFKVRLSVEEDKYVVSNIVMRHNHKLASPTSTKFLKSHRHISEADYAQAHVLRRVGMKTSQIMKLFVLQCGGYNNVPFTIKDLYNKMNSERMEEIADGDAEGAFAYLFGKKDVDPNLYFNFTVDSEGRLSRLFWSDSRSREDYRCFGDVLVFDSTYNTNKYLHPLVVMCGINNHFSTSIFACSTVREEDEGAYEWVLNTFLEAMDGKKPISVVTDGAPQMRKAIKKCLPNTKHRLCCWHLNQNLNSHVGNEDFRAGFKDCMYNNCSIDKFEAKWAKLVCSFNMENNDWVNQVYRKRKRWALAYLRGYFFGGMRSTQRCERMHAMLKIYLHRELRLFETLRAFDLANAWLRHEEARMNVETEHTSLLPATETHYLEQHAAEVFTRRIFLKVRAEMRSQGLYFRYNAMDDGVQCIHFISHSYSNKERRVLYNRTSGIMSCSCLQMKTVGLPCSHMFRIMVIEGMKKIPPNCIMQRWMRDARRGRSGSLRERSEVTNVNEMARYARLSSGCNTMCYYGAKTTTGYTRLLNVIDIQTAEMKTLSLEESTATGSSSQAHRKGDASGKVGIGDPHANRPRGDQRTKGKERHIRNKCGNCGGFMYILTFCGSGREGHNKRTCPLHIENPNDDLSHALGMSPDIFEGNTSAAWVRGGMNMHFNSDNDWDQLDHQLHDVGVKQGLEPIHGFQQSVDTTNYTWLNNGNLSNYQPVDDEEEEDIDLNRDIMYPAW
ncbi:protein FAR1-RELATED SEQUENCE 5-like [Coffea arabica]|uniref:Protein FAR1-RELATED SEQUENCE 5-like n=1 Tax=Coffea arabica TaxID=13443 RepID=A0ABM4VU37_COFAR